MIWMIVKSCIYRDREVANVGEKMHLKGVIIHEEKWMQLLKKEDDFSI